MNQEHYPDRYVTFRKWHPRVAYFVLLPLLLVGGLLIALSYNGPDSFTGKHGWHPLMQGLGWGFFLISMGTNIVLEIIAKAVNKTKR